jgi:CheY-like chemotaxis protein
MNQRPDTPKAATILVVDDNPQVREVTALMLQSAGHTVLSAATAREGLGLAAAYPGPIDLLLSDLGLPGMSGVDLGQALAQSRPEVRVLFFSGDILAQLARKEVSALKDPFLAKPFRLSELLAKVREILER